MLNYKQRYKPRTEREYTKSDLTVYDSAGNTALNALTIYGKSEVVDGEIVSAGDSGSIEVQSYTGTNQFGGLDFAQKLNIASNVSVINTTHKTVTFQRYGNITPIVYDNFKPNTQYTFIMSYSNTALNNCLRIKYDTGIDDVFQFTASNTKSTIVLTTNPTRNVKQLYLSYYTANETILYYDECGIFEGVKTASDFKPYNGTMATFTTGTPLYGVSDTVRDVMEWDGTSGEVTKNCGKISIPEKQWTFDAELSNQNRSCFYVLMTDMKFPTSVTDLMPLICNNLTVVPQNLTWEPGQVSCRIPYNLLVVIVEPTITTQEQLKTQYAGSELVHELATPTTEQLTTAENTSIASLRAFDGTTHFTNNATTDMTINYTIKTPTI